MARLSDYLRNIFFLLLLLQVAPPLLRSIRNQYATYLEPKAKVGVVTIKSVLTDTTSSIKQLRKFFKEHDIKAIVLKLDSSGGAAGASQALALEIEELKRQHVKPIVTFVQNVCASGAYYVAAATDRIITTPSAFVGSIGVYIPQPHLKEFIEQFKIKYDVVKTGDYKTAGDPFQPTTPEQQAMLQSLTDDTYRQFTQYVSKMRPQLQLAQVGVWGNGKVFTGHQGLELGLVDEIGSQSTVEKVLRKIAPIEGEIEWVKPPRPSGLAALFGTTSDDDSQEGDSYIESCIDRGATALINALARTGKPYLLSCA